MVTSVGTSNGSVGFIPGTGQSRTSLEGEVATCRKQMADWVTCPSAKTPQGQAKIKDISERMAAAQSRLDALPSSKPLPQSEPRSVTKSATTAGPQALDVYA